MSNSVHFLSNKNDWETPQDLFDSLNAKYRFDLDVCATAENTKLPWYISPEQDALSMRWEGMCWMNPPYGHQIGKWVKKAWEESLKGATVVCLLPARTDTAWWHEYCMKGRITFLRGRLKFVGAANSAPFPSAVVVFAGTYKCAVCVWCWEEPGVPVYCRLVRDPAVCRGPETQEGE